MVRALIGSLTLGALFALTLLGCDDPSRTTPTEASARAPVAPLSPEPRFAVSGEASFDLALTTDGALLAWAELAGQVVQIRSVMLDRKGGARGEARTLAKLPKGTSVAEITAGSSPTVVAVAWIERSASGALARAVLGDAALGTFAEPAPVATASIGSLGRRGNLALASDRERMMAFVRGEREPCPDDRSETCTRLGFAELAGTSPSPRRIPLSVPAPCTSAIAGFVVLGGRWHYAVCSTAAGREVITAFRIQYQPRYAEAHEVLPRCAPAGATAVGDDVLVAAECESGRRAVRVAGADAKPIELDLSESKLACELGHPLLSPLGLRLSEPKDGLAPLLPADIAPTGARALWTGTTLLVARFVAGGVSVHRYGCEAGEWTRYSG